MSAGPIEGWLIASHTFPPTGYTVDDWLKLPQTGERVELIDGSFVVQAVPASNHAICATRLVHLLDDAAPDHLEVVQAVGILVGEDGLIPDIVVADADVLRPGDTGGPPQGLRCLRRRRSMVRRERVS